MLAVFVEEQRLQVAILSTKSLENKVDAFLGDELTRIDNAAVTLEEAGYQPCYPVSQPWQRVAFHRDVARNRFRQGFVTRNRAF